MSPYIGINVFIKLHSSALQLHACMKEDMLTIYYHSCTAPTEHICTTHNDNYGMGQLLRMYNRITVDSRYFGSLKYGHLDTGHLVWHGLLARCLLHKTRLEMWPLAIPYTCCPKL